MKKLIIYFSLFVVLSFDCISQSKEIINAEIDAVVNKKIGCSSPFNKLNNQNIFIYHLKLYPNFKAYYGARNYDSDYYRLIKKIDKELTKRGFIIADPESFYDSCIGPYRFSDRTDRFFYTPNFNDVLKSNSIELADIRNNSRNRTPSEALKLYPQHREFIKELYKNWCNGFNNCEEYLVAFPKQKYDPEISKNQERRRAASDALINSLSKSMDNFKNSAQTASSSSSSSSSNSSDGKAKAVGTFDDFVKKSKMKYVKAVPFSSFGLGAENKCPCKEYELDTGDEHMKYMFKNSVHKIYEDENKNWWLKQPVQTEDEKFESLSDLLRRIYDKNYN